MWYSFLLWMIFSHFCLQTAETLGIQNEHPCQWAPYRHQRSFKLVFHDVLYPDAPLWAGCRPGSLGFSRLHFYWGKPSPRGSQLARLSEWGSGDAFVYLMMFLFVCLFVCRLFSSWLKQNSPLSDKDNVLPTELFLQFAY